VLYASVSDHGDDEDETVVGHNVVKFVLGHDLEGLQEAWESDTCVHNYIICSKCVFFMYVIYIYRCVVYMLVSHIIIIDTNIIVVIIIIYTLMFW
jgi:hypothetical protein